MPFSKAKPHDAYRRMSIGDNVDHAFTAKQAVRFLEKAETPYDVASLDHDLDESDRAGASELCSREPIAGGLEPSEGSTFTMGQPPRDLTGYYVAQYISKMPPEKLPKKIIIHSFNNTGSVPTADSNVE